MVMNITYTGILSTLNNKALFQNTLVENCQGGQEARRKIERLFFKSRSVLHPLHHHVDILWDSPAVHGASLWTICQSGTYNCMESCTHL